MVVANEYFQTYVYYGLTYVYYGLRLELRIMTVTELHMGLTRIALTREPEGVRRCCFVGVTLLHGLYKDDIVCVDHQKHINLKLERDEVDCIKNFVLGYGGAIWMHN